MRTTCVQLITSICLCNVNKTRCKEDRNNNKTQIIKIQPVKGCQNDATLKLVIVGGVPL